MKLEHILEGMEMQSKESNAYLNLETGENVYVSRVALLMADSKNIDYIE